MVLILHGDNVLASRQKLKQETDSFKKNFAGEVFYFKGKDLTLNNLVLLFESAGFFSQKKLLIIEKLISAKIGQKDKIFEYLKRAQDEIICWEDKKITSRQISSLGAKSLLFQTPSQVFQFLDSIFPGNSRVILRFLGNALENTPAELIFYMLVKHTKSLIASVDQNAQAQLNMPDWRVGKLSRQAKMFDLDDLFSLYKKLRDIEFSIKSGRSTFSLTANLELLFSSI